MTLGVNKILDDEQVLTDQTPLQIGDLARFDSLAEKHDIEDQRRRLLQPRENTPFLLARWLKYLLDQTLRIIK